MVIQVKHGFVSNKSDSPDATLIQPGCADNDHWRGAR